MILELDGVSSGYDGSEILHGITLHIDVGQIVSVLGPNGAGKTTLLKTIMGILRAYKGRIRFEGADLVRTKPDKILRLGITYIPQGRSIFPWMSVRDNLAMGAYLIKDREVVKSRIDHVFELFPRLKERSSAEANVLSGGERQMLAIGRALMLAPKIVMLDEPSLGLDPRFLSTVYRKIKELNSGGTTILLVEQNVAKALAISDYAYVVEAGRVALEGTPDVLSSDERIRDAYLGGGTRASDEAR